jgi:hypothetical protein
LPHQPFSPDEILNLLFIPRGTRVEQYHWIVSWLEKHRLFKTLDTLLEEGAEIASESFGLSKVGEGAVRSDEFGGNSHIQEHNQRIKIWALCEDSYSLGLLYCLNLLL